MIQQKTAHLRNILIAVAFYLALAVLAIIVVAGVFLFALLYTIAIFGPWMMGRFPIKAHFRRLIDWVFGIESIHRFRKDIRGLIAEHAEFPHHDRTVLEIRRNIIELHGEASERAERGEFVIAIVAGAFSIVIGNLTGLSILGLLVGSYAVVMSLTIGVHVVVLDILAYNDMGTLDKYRRNELLLIEGWNRMILSSRRNQAVVLAIGLLRKISRIGYEIARDLLDEALEKDMDRLERYSFIIFAIAAIAEGILSPSK